MIVSLTGFMGCGKTCTGRALAERLGWEFVDLDEYIVHKWGRSVPELFGEGELFFRALEAEAVRDVIVMRQVAGGDLVLALGGGTLEITSVKPLILEQTVCIYLEAGESFLRGWLEGTESRRPMLASCDISALLERRRPVYELAPYRVDAELPPEQLLSAILSKIPNC